MQSDLGGVGRASEAEAGRPPTELIELGEKHVGLDRLTCILSMAPTHGDCTDTSLK